MSAMNSSGFRCVIIHVKPDGCRQKIREQKSGMRGRKQVNKLEDAVEIKVEQIETVVERHMGFLIRTVSSMTGRYVAVEHDDAFSIGLEAFVEAVARYDPGRGAFMPFAKLVIQSRLTTYLQRECKREDTVSLDALLEQGQEVAKPSQEENGALQEEIASFQEELLGFHLTLEDLVHHAPKHRDTRERALGIADRSSRKEQVVKETYKKKKLPVRMVAEHCHTTEKIVKGSRHFILAAMLIFIKKFPMLLQWVQNGRQNYV